MTCGLGKLPRAGRSAVGGCGFHWCQAWSLGRVLAAVVVAAVSNTLLRARDDAFGAAADNELLLDDLSVARCKLARNDLLGGLTDSG